MKTAEIGSIKSQVVKLQLRYPTFWKEASWGGSFLRQDQNPATWYQTSFHEGLSKHRPAARQKIRWTSPTLLWDWSYFEHLEVFLSDLPLRTKHQSVCVCVFLLKACRDTSQALTQSWAYKASERRNDFSGVSHVSAPAAAAALWPAGAWFLLLVLTLMIYLDHIQKHGFWSVTVRRRRGYPLNTCSYAKC